jgi:Ca2+-binding RTX toxin-like protein
VRKIEVLVGVGRRTAALRIGVVSALLLLALPGIASAASTVSLAGTTVIVTGDAGNNDITVTHNAAAPPTFTIRDTTGVTTLAVGCTSTPPDQVTCPAPATNPRTTVNAGAGDDKVQGSAALDVINGEAGNDDLHGGPGNDTISGGGGTDLLNSGGGGCPTLANQAFCQDIVNGNNEFDTLTYADRTAPAGVKLDLRPGTGAAVDDDGRTDGIGEIERFIGGQASDELIGGITNETFNGGPGSAPDVICGGLGRDTVEYSDKDAPVNVTLDGVLPTDPDLVSNDPIRSVGGRQDCRLRIKSSDVRNGLPCVANSWETYPSCREGFTSLDDPPPPIEAGPALVTRDCTADDGVQDEKDCVGEDIENVVGSPADDVLIGNDVDALYGQSPRIEPQGVNTLEGGEGNDRLDGGLGPDVLDGGAGTDAVSYEGRAEGVAASIDGAANDGSAADRDAESNQTDQIMPSIEDLIGGNGDDVLKGDGGDNGLSGGPGADLVQGHGGNDSLGGDDGDDRLEGGAGGDAMDGGPGDDLLFGGFESDAYEGGAGTDTADFSDATTPVSVTLNGAADDGRGGEGDNVAGTIESLIGGLDDDRLNANDGNGILQGGGGNDVLNGGLGSDLLVGGRCQDQVAPICEDAVGAGDPKGVDTAAYGGHPGPVQVTLGSPGGGGVAGEGDAIANDVEGLGGSSSDDVLGGDAKLNSINGGAGNDRISGGPGDDFLAGHLGNDTVNGDDGNDTADGAEGNDALNGGAGSDNLRGFTGTDILDGGTGADTMSGGDGTDTVTYASRTADVTVDTLGDPDDGQRGENDQVRTDIESVRTGSGDDSIDIGDGATGSATCGGGTDEVVADPIDEIGAGCEAAGVRQSGICVPRERTAQMSRSGVVSLRMTCAFSAKGSVRLRSAGRVKTGKGKARVLNLGRKSFTGKLGRLTVKVKVASTGRRVIRQKKRLRVHAILSVRRDAANAAMRRNRSTVTVRASGK